MPVSEHLVAVSVKGYRELLRKLRQKKSDETSTAFEDARQRVSLYILTKKSVRKPLDPVGAWNRLHARLLLAKTVSKKALFGTSCLLFFAEQLQSSLLHAVAGDMQR